MDSITTEQCDHVQGFYLNKSGIRGRIVRLGPALDAIIRRHDYPEPVAAVLAEAMALTVALAYALKYDGVFTLQTKADGPVGMLVADIAKGGHLRGYAQFDAHKVKLAGVRSALLLGKGYLAFTVDQGGNHERYQGVVDLIGRDMAACVHTYFRQSEQLDTGFRVHVGRDQDGAWHAAALMVQRLPEGGGYAANNNIALGEKQSEEREEDWRRTLVLMETTQDAEMFDADLDSARLLHRLFHEEGLETGESHPLHDQCRCSRARVAMVLSTLSKAELQEMKVDGTIKVTCEFCSSQYDFDDTQLDKLAAGPGVRE